MPGFGFAESDGELWGRWLDTNARVHLRTIETLDRMEAHLKWVEHHLNSASSAATLSALISFRHHVSANRETDPDFEDWVRRSYETYTGLRLPPIDPPASDDEGEEGGSPADATGDGDVPMGSETVAEET